MVFTYKKWDSFCKKLKDKHLTSIPACEVGASSDSFVVLKHDVETDVCKAYRMAQIENEYGHRGSYYVQASLLKDAKNIELLRQMQKLGHEISYHYDVMDSQKGNLDLAIAEFEDNRALFEQNGFAIRTVCQHGNPIVERVGYTSNRDFFRSRRVRTRYSEISDIMVNFKEMVNVDYDYFSDAGRKFKMIFDPINNDINSSETKDIPYEDLDELCDAITAEKNAIISTHPHRWCSNAVVYTIKNIFFKTAKSIAKIMIKIPFLRKLMSRYYYLAKKI